MAPLSLGFSWPRPTMYDLLMGSKLWYLASAAGQIRMVKLNGHEPHAYLSDILERLPTQPASRVAELLPHRWQPATTS